METPDRLVWRKSSYSDNNGGACVEVATRRGNVIVRDSKNAAGPVLRFDGQSWSAFLRTLKR
ncbi:MULTISPECIES: DUF397 domain-containing protein [Micromonospora]|uniref:Regulator n=1 Tax=Micromonospora maris TaxID=1003110 RepID=A0A9X0I8M4_9ACTN|nr:MULTISPECIES: DUF397 domain-containing protein [Micromonospora]AEB43595.1 hypothetical protein VAB18032_12405 [Micromonospora maris AB-18-032]KUJ48896.1 regulator [Micromonospora maris]RUL91743.1 DUF397 domain-containing protein [Verrucosispora sp. FIM060022]